MTHAEGSEAFNLLGDTEFDEASNGQLIIEGVEPEDPDRTTIRNRLGQLSIFN